MNVALRMGFWKMQVVIQILFFFKKAQDSHSVALACTLSSVFFFFHPSTFIAPSIQAFAHMGQILRYMEYVSTEVLFS